MYVQWVKVSYQRRYEVYAGHVVDVVNLNVASNTFVPAAFDRTLEYVSVVKVLHRLGAQIYTEMLQLAGLWILETKHVEDPDETVCRVSDRVVQGCHTPRACTTCTMSIGLEA